MLHAAGNDGGAALLEKRLQTDAAVPAEGGG